MSTTTNQTNATDAPSWPTLDPVLLDYWRKSHWIDFGFRIIFVLVGLVTTILGLVATYRVRSSRSYGFVRILYSVFVCLLVNQLFVMVFDIIQYGHRYHWPMGDALCRIHNFVTEAMEGAIVYQLLIVSGYMVLAIKKPGWTQRLDTRKGAAIFLGVFWFLVFAFNAEALGSQSTMSFGSFTDCWYTGRTGRHWNIIVFGILVFYNYIPMFLLAGMAGYLYYHNRSQAGAEYQRADSGSGGNSRDNFRLSLSYAVLFIVCRLPSTIIWTRSMLGYYIKWSWSLSFWFTLDLTWFLYDLYSAVLPLFFLLLLSDLRLEARSLLGHVTGMAPPAYNKQLGHKTGTDDEANLI